MHMIRTRAAPSKSAAHNPDICGIDPTTDCDECRESRVRAERDFYSRDAEARQRAWLRSIEEHLEQQTGIPMADLDAAILHRLAKPMADIAGAVLDERQATQ